jgi:hypothetical protein
VSSLKRIKKDNVVWFAKEGACADSGADASRSGRVRFNDKFLSVALRCRCNGPLDATRDLTILVLVSQLFVQRGWNDITL